MKKITLPHEIRLEAEKNASDFFKKDTPEWKNAVHEYLKEFYMETQPNPQKPMNNPAPEEVKIAKKLYPEIFEKGLSKDQVMRITMAAETLVNTILGLGIKIPNTGYSYEAESNEQSQRLVLQNRYRRFLIRIFVYEMIANLTDISNQDVDDIISSAKLDQYPIKTLESKSALDQFGHQIKNRLRSFFKRLSFKDIIFKESEIKKTS